MPEIEVVFYRNARGHTPVRAWLLALEARDRRAFAKCVARVRRLADFGHELTRPESGYIGEGLHELRARSGRVNHRILYFFHRRRRAVLVHALTKERRISRVDVESARRRMAEYVADPETHTHREDP